MIGSFPSTADNRAYHEGTTTEQHPGREWATVEKVGIPGREPGVFRGGEDPASLQITFVGT